MFKYKGQLKFLESRQTMRIDISPTSLEAGRRAADKSAAAIQSAIEARGQAAVILATGASQFDLLDALVKKPDIDWSRVTIFHLDEYIGIDASHPASFVRYLKERFLRRISSVADFISINGSASDIDLEIKRISDAIGRVAIDVALVGVGENGHLAFNDPPADFDTHAPYMRVSLDEKCRMQQANEGWFPSFESVPAHAISMSINQIMKSNTIICTVPDERKSEAVKVVLEGEISNLCPASILQSHNNTFFYLDMAAASKLRRETSE